MNKTSTSNRNSKDRAPAKTSTRGRPVMKTFPAPIPDTLENVALSVVNTSPKKDHEWDYLKESE